MVVVTAAGVVGAMLAQAGGDCRFGTYKPLVSNAPNTTMVALGDADADGDSDLVLGAGAAIELRTNNGDAAFATTGTTMTLAGPLVGLVAGDFRGDGKFELAVLSSPVGASGSQVTWVQRKSGDGSLFSSATLGLGMRYHQLVGVDANLDGRLDLALLSQARQAVTVISGPSPGSVVTRHYQVGGLPLWLAAGDVTGDALPDLIIGENTGGATSAAAAKVLQGLRPGQLLP